MEAKELINLYCKWCPKDCKGLSEEERQGCLAAGGFVDEFRELEAEGRTNIGVVELRERVDKILEERMDEIDAHGVVGVSIPKEIMVDPVGETAIYLRREVLRTCKEYMLGWLGRHGNQGQVELFKEEFEVEG